MKTIILVAAICLFVSANSDGMSGYKGVILRSCLRNCQREQQMCTTSCFEKKMTVEEEKQCQDSYIKYLGGEDTYCVRDECLEACLTVYSQCVRGCKSN
ncbi:hypothetical protein LSAT2_008097 [Lamellibrachia satsuma]|nr:hypothetical protein LSAT2_008097 [Lamellibrachia satsuma]